MIKTGLWLELEATIGFMVGLGLGSLIGQRTVAVVLMIVLEIILTPIISRHVIPHLLNLQRGVVGLATAHLEPGGLPLTFGGGGGPQGEPIWDWCPSRPPWPSASSWAGWWCGRCSAPGGWSGETPDCRRPGVDPRSHACPLRRAIAVTRLQQVQATVVAWFPSDSNLLGAWQ